MSIVEQMLSKYEINSEDEMINALKEVYQEIALSNPIEKSIASGLLTRTSSYSAAKEPLLI